MNSPSEKTVTRVINSLDDVDNLMNLMKKNKIDYAEVDGYKFSKTQHEFDIPKATPENENDFWKNPLA
jgi:hypothetical protein